jgi:hypothetical protein
LRRSSSRRSAKGELSSIFQADDEQGELADDEQGETSRESCKRRAVSAVATRLALALGKAARELSPESCRPAS